jgi:uncharacterized membrane protein YoaK (UPF0700 family)
MTPDAAPVGSRGRVRAVILALAAIAGWLDGLTFVALGSVVVSAVTGDLVQVGRAPRSSVSASAARPSMR